ncbi:hypothetical protein Ddc_16094 [Ditylenchus destructor]|nr:hypothetical protein Ddc_16094 [Ditylenchus destructor]
MRRKEKCFAKQIALWARYNRTVISKGAAAATGVGGYVWVGSGKRRREQRFVRVFRETGPPPRNGKKGVGKAKTSGFLTAVGSSQEHLWALLVMIGEKEAR